MKIIITKSQREKIATKWMNDNFGLDKLVRYNHPKKSNFVIYGKDRKAFIVLDKKSKYVQFEDGNIWSFLKSFFGMEGKEIQNFLKGWLEETQNIKGFTPICGKRLWLK